MKRSSSGHSKRVEDERSITSLPLDISKDIISRLPIRSIIQSRCGCRSWELLSKDPHVFHMQISRRCPGSKLFFFHQYKGNQLHFIEFNNSDENVGIVRKIDSMPKFVEKPPCYAFLPGFMITASCNGLLCLEEYAAEDNDWICIYSAFTRDYKIIPKLDSKYTPYAYGFGCHPVTGEYKLVRIGYYDGEDDDGDDDEEDDHIISLPCESEVQVYSLSRNEWRSIGRLPDEQLYPVDPEGGGVLLGGRLHWLSEWKPIPGSDLNPSAGLIYFDVADDSLGKIPMPAEIILKNCLTSQLVVLTGCLSIALTKRYDPPEWIEIWVMKEYGVEKSWVKQYSIQRDGFRKTDPKWHGMEIVQILCLLDNGEILLQYSEEMLVSYNCDTKICSRVTFGGTLPRMSWLKTTLDASSC